MKKADLVALGIEDEEVIKQIIILHGKDIESLKATNEETVGQVTTLQAKLEEADKAIASFKEMDVDSIKAAADEWKAKAEKAEAEAQAKVHAVKFDYEVDRVLTAAKAKNPKAVKALLDLETVKFSEDGVLEGLEDQLESIKEENDFLFESDTPVPRVVSGANNKTITSDATVVAARKAAGLTSKEN